MQEIGHQIFRIVIASLVGTVIGLERMKRGKSAGVGTFSVICIAACFLTIISVYGIADGDPSRLIANIITAIGFVAGGVIFTVSKSDKVQVNGLTTGAEIFCVAALGIGIGLGMHFIVLAVVLLVKFNLAIAYKLKKKYGLLKKDNQSEEENEESDHPETDV